MTAENRSVHGGSVEAKKMRPHVVLVPFFAQGHLIPMTDLARLLGERGDVVVTFITTPVNADRFRPVIRRIESSSGERVRFFELSFPSKEAGLPEGMENADLLTNNNFLNFFTATDLLRRPFDDVLINLDPPASCVVYDNCHPWAAEVARGRGIPTVVFHGPSAFFIFASHVLYHDKVYDRDIGDYDPVEIPGLPEHMETTKAYIPGWFNSPSFEKLREEVYAAEAAVDGVVLNSFYELEPIFIDSYEKVLRKKIWSIGPLCLYDKDAGNKSVRGNAAAVDESRLLSWLDAKHPSSVLYVSFGSLVRVSAPQLKELGLGLEASGKPFIWVIRRSNLSPEMEEWMSGYSFEERVGERALVIRGWAPQTVILGHPAVGGFLTHCGWNSTLEAVAAGLPMITWPHFVDQFANERLVVEFMRTGVPIGVKKTPFHTEEDEIAVSRDDVAAAVRSLFDAGEEAEGRRRRAEDLKKKAAMAVEEGGSSLRNVDLFVNHFVNGQQVGFVVGEEKP